MSPGRRLVIAGRCRIPGRALGPLGDWSCGGAQQVTRPDHARPGDDAAERQADRVLQRCVMVGMAQPGLTESGEVLRRLGRRASHPVCLALGGSITRPGVVRAGDLLRAAAAPVTQPA